MILTDRLRPITKTQIVQGQVSEYQEGRMPFPVKAIQVGDGSGCDQESGNMRQLPDRKTYLKAYEGHLAARDFRL